MAGTNSTDGRSAIPSFQPDREEFLEYDVAKLIHELGTPKKPVIGLMSSLGLQGQFNPMTGQMGEPWPISPSSQQLFTMRTLTPDLDHIDKDVDVLMLVHPKQLPPKTLYAIDQFVMRGGRVLLFVDPDCRRRHERPGSLESDGRRDGQSFLGSGAAARGLGRRLRSRPRSSAIWSSGSRCAPACRRRRRATSASSGLRHDDMNQKDVVTASLESINLATVGFLVAARRRQDHVRAAAA